VHGRARSMLAANGACSQAQLGNEFRRFTVVALHRSTTVPIHGGRNLTFIDAIEITSIDYR